MDAPPTFMPNPYGNFDPSQWSNPYSLYNNQAFPWPPTYAGTPTDALGRPIASYQPPQAPAAPAATPASTTLNSSPGLNGPDPGMLNGMPDPRTAIMGMTPQQFQAANAAQNPDPASQAFVNAWFNVGGQQPMNPYIPPFNPQPQQQAPAGPAAPPNNWQAALAALANPGKVTTPGATVPQAPTAGSNGVLQQFLAGWQPAASGPGSGFQQGFARALRSK
jgi:hypothetical protein